jgi:hypothetical protein
MPPSPRIGPKMLLLTNVASALAARLRSLIWLLVVFLYFVQLNVKNWVFRDLKKLLLYSRPLPPPPLSNTVLSHFYTESVYLKENAKSPKHLAISVVIPQQERSITTKVFHSLWGSFVRLFSRHYKSGESIVFSGDSNQKNTKKQDFEEKNRIKDADDEGFDKEALKSLARLVAWAWIADVAVVSLYDYDGK